MLDPVVLYVECLISEWSEGIVVMSVCDGPEMWGTRKTHNENRLCLILLCYV